MKKKAVVDRIIDKHVATLLIGSEEKEYTIPLAQLPKGIREGVWLTVSVINNNVQVIDINHRETEKRERKANQLMEKLNHKKGSKFKQT